MDGTTKHRLVWDLPRSGVNTLVRQGDRIILPRVSDVLEDRAELQVGLTPTEELYVFGTDVSDAFHQIPIHLS